MDERIKIFNNIFSTSENIKVLEEFKEKYNQPVFYGKILVDNIKNPLTFDVEIPFSYPLCPLRNESSIRFYCHEIKGYRHLNNDNSICIHSETELDIEKKLKKEIEYLKNWIQKYYIEEKEDERYQYIVFPNTYDYIFMFSDLNCSFSKYENGFFDYSSILNNTFLIQNIVKKSGDDFGCNWTNSYKNLPKHYGIWIFTDKEPIKEKRLAITNWKDMETYFTQNDLSFIYHEYGYNIKNKQELHPIFLLIGYKIPNNQIHWNIIEIDKNNFPIIENNNKYFCKYIIIKWQETKNISYNRFFGRGKYSDKLTESKILIVGIGAIGSFLATSLTRGGIRNLSLSDFDIVEPGNICRANYFISDIFDSKIKALFKQLINISPYINITGENMRKSIPNEDYFYELKEKLNNYDFIFDCTADKEFGYMLDLMKLKTKIISFSITNQAKNFISITGNNITNDREEILKQFDSNEEANFIEGTGCHLPTFSASYTDINMMLSYAINLINNKLEKNYLINSFVITKIEEGSSFNLKLNEY